MFVFTGIEIEIGRLDQKIQFGGVRKRASQTRRYGFGPPSERTRLRDRETAQTAHKAIGWRRRTSRHNSSASIRQQRERRVDNERIGAGSNQFARFTRHWQHRIHVPQHRRAAKAEPEAASTRQ